MCVRDKGSSVRLGGGGVWIMGVDPYSMMYASLQHFSPSICTWMITPVSGESSGSSHR